ncbi:MAG: tail fiber domain-containing protein, partial [Saprospiraceae bacterium]|nr:tail fiber domain-containing protein [Saprospiraceae bacterium]
NVLSRVIYANGVGVYGSSQNGFGVVGDSRGSSDFWAVHGSYGNSSSRRWKSNIENIEDPLEKVSRLRGVTFDWDEEHGGKHSVGFIAEEVGAVLPEIVWFEENGIDARGMDYSKMTPLLVEVANAMRKEYQELLDIQDQKIQNLEKEIDALKALFSANENTIK